MKIELNNRIALVTGGTGPVGTAICKQLSLSGARVITDYQNEDIREWQHKLNDSGFNITAIKGDIMDFDECIKLVETIENEIGPIDIIVNSNELDHAVAFNEMEKSDWDHVLSSNVDVLFNLCRNVAERMCNRGFGRIINISSIISRMGAAEKCHLAAAKSGIHGFSMALSQEVGKKGVTVNTISPGIQGQASSWIPAETGLDNRGENEIAYLVDFLCSDQASFINGADIAINGGEYLH